MSNTNSGLLGIKDIVFMNVIAILSLRQIPNVAPYGASAMLLWVIAAFCLFFPLAMVCGELSTGWPKDGGIFVWIKEAFGKRIAWIVVVCFLFSCVLFFPLMLQFGFTALGYMIGGGLAENKAFIGIGSAVIFWLLTLMNIRGMEWTKLSIASALGAAYLFPPPSSFYWRWYGYVPDTRCRRTTLQRKTGFRISDTGIRSFSYPA